MRTDYEGYGKELTSSAGETSERSPVVANEQSGEAFALENINLIVQKLALRDGSLSVSGPVAYVTQTPWILNRTVQSNILFGMPMNTSRYFKIGERGVTISGGQKARISLARALFSNSRIYVLDDIFASLDQQVADRIFKRAVKEMLANKTRLAKCDRICYMEGGKIKGEGPHEELLEKCEAYALFCEHATYPRSTPKTLEDRRGSDDDFVKVDAPEAPKTSKSSTLEDIEASTSIPDFINESGEEYIVSTSLAGSESTGFYATIYGFSVLFLFASGFLKALIFVHVSLNAASRLHNRMFNSVIRGAVQFFDTTPTGRILNRFSKDMDEKDS
uniref:ABC transmembrane type-1 domain-containing protein n=1 Tax=Gongylonema pulchrum TaxID=637853 RepID=A0A183E8A0_9BILA